MTTINLLIKHGWNLATPILLNPLNLIQNGFQKPITMNVIFVHIAVVFMFEKKVNMSLFEFALSIFAGCLSNMFSARLDTLTKPQPDESCMDEQKVLQNDISGEKKTQHFRTFDVYYDLEKILRHIIDPIAHIIIEKESTTAWNLASLVLESQATGKWYLFERGRMAMQGDGGGIRQSKIVIERLKEAKAIITSWALPKTILDDFEEGIILWCEVKLKAIPLFSSMSVQEDWQLIQEKIRGFSLSTANKTSFEI